jgi:nicotinate-nucleotide adenylyltransferase
MAAARSVPERVFATESFVGRSIGILGGTFNPPHLAHLALARAAIGELGLERVLLIPARMAPHKPSAEDPGVEHRLRMCQLAAGSDPRVDVCTIELHRAGPSYTVDTLRSIHATNPDVELTLIVGADMAQALPTWCDPRAILRLARLAVAERDGLAGEAVRAAVRGLNSVTDPVFLRMAPLQASSSKVRASVAAGEPIEGLVGREVARYIAEHGLYRTDPAHPSAGVTHTDPASPGSAVSPLGAQERRA